MWYAADFLSEKVVNVMFISFFIIILVATDQILKYAVTTNLRYAEDVTIIPNLLDITYVENRGAAFGIFQNQRWFFIIFAALMIAFFIYLIKYENLNDKMFLTAAALIISGGLGNLIDRLFLGYVVDYIKLSFFSPICNFADYCITFGTIILIIYVVFFYKDIKN